MSSKLRARLPMFGGPNPVTRSYPGTTVSTAFAPNWMSRNAGRAALAAIRYSSGFNAPAAPPPLAIRNWSITAVSPAQIGAACEVPPPVSTLPSNTIRAPVNGSAAGETAGDIRCVESRVADTLRCQSGRPNSADTPPLLPMLSGGLNHACSASHMPFPSTDSAVPPTAVISGSDETASSPTSDGPGGEDQSSPPLHCRPALSPVAANADVPCDCAFARAERTGARSAAVSSLSHAHPIDRLQTAAGN